MQKDLLNCCICFPFFLFFFFRGGKDLFDGGLTDRSGRNCEGVCS